MDLLTHLFLPITIAYVLKPSLFNPPWHLALAIFGLVPDFDKFLGVPGLLHSLVTLVPLGIALLGIEYGFKRRLEYSVIATLLLWSHLLLDLIDGGPVPVFAPFVDTGIGLTYPMQVTFGSGLLGIVIHGPPIALRIAAPRPGFNTYGLVNGFGVVSVLMFVLFFVGLRGNRTNPGGDP